MDTSINQQDLYSSREILKRLVCTPGHIITEADLCATDIDVDLLESMYDNNIKPYLPYLHGYERLEDLDPLRRRRLLLEGTPRRWLPELQSWNGAHNGKDDVFLWYSLLARCDMLGQRTKARSVISVTLRLSKDFPASVVTVAFFLTTSAKWLFWSIEGDMMNGTTFRNERLTVHGTVREALEAFSALMPGHYSMAVNYVPVQSLPLHIERSLRGILDETINEKERRLDTLKESLASAKRRIGIVHQ